MKLEKFTVCKNCTSVGITHPDCSCSWANNYETIELEFEVCECCGNLKSDGNPAETDFNNEQFIKFNT